ncbi:MAG TPA: Zn-ribbon domain-containing OB-fold protein, partial [Thermoplasmata archaeon]|nr:Zn-ribbon domain-containing OB-fold protein [Thermoplasmata archaeon]
PRPVCPECTSHRQSIEKMVPFQLSGAGEVFSYTIVHEPAEGFEMQVPYVLALVKTVEGPVLTGQVVDLDPASVRIGLRVHATFRKLREEGPAGVIHYGYKFAPEGDGEVVLPPAQRGETAPAKRPTTDRAKA